MRFAKSDSIFSTDSDDKREELYRSTDYYLPLSPVSALDDGVSRRSIILPVGEAIDNANYRAPPGNRLNERLGVSRARENRFNTAPLTYYAHV